MRLLITGGRSDIGQAIIRRRSSMGDHILTTASSEPTLNDLQEKLKDLKNVTCCQWDLTTPDQNSAAIEAFIQQGVEGLVLNAAAPTRVLKRLHEMTDAEMQTVLQTQMYGNMWLLKRALEKMQAQNYGRVLFISSATIYGTSRYGAYSMAKAGIEALIRTIGTDYGEFNIRANSIRPGVVATERTKRFWARSTYVQAMSAAIPAGHLGEPIHIAEASDIFLSPNCYANGTSLDVTGGLPNIRSEVLLKIQP